MFVMERLVSSMNLFFFEDLFEINVKIVIRLLYIMINVLIQKIMNYGCVFVFVGEGIVVLF